VVVADDNGKILSLISKVLSQQCEIVGEAVDGEQAMEMTLRLRPDVLVLDISMPHLSGLEVARRLAAAGSAVNIVFLTALEEREYVEAAFKLGARGYVFKRLLRKDLPIAIAAAVEGRTFYPAMPPAALPGWLDMDRVGSDLNFSRENEPAVPVNRNIFSPGDTAPSSGIYRVIHGNCDLERHYVTAIYGEVFPSCLKCSSAVRFELRLSAIRLSAHPMFEREE
jgi:CheY-like chemotaxis protein